MSTDLSLSYMDQYGDRLIDNGYRILPIAPGTKKPGRVIDGEWRDYAKWTQHCERDTKGFEVSIWRRWPGCAIGVACGDVVAIDIDILDDPLAKQVQAVATEHFGSTPAFRIGKAPKRLLVYRAEGRVKARKVGAVEILGQGRQFLAYAIHPETKRPYTWPIESLIDIDIGDLPAINEKQINGFLEAVAPLLPTTSMFDGLSDDDCQTGDLIGDPDALAEAMEWLPNPDLHWEDWNRVGMALYAGTSGDDKGFALFDGWSRHSAKYDAKETQKRWAGYRRSPPTHIGAGTIYHFAERSGWIPGADIYLNPHKRQAAETQPAAELIAKAEAVVAPKPTQQTTPAGITKPAGILGDMVEEITRTAYSPQPLLAVAAAICAVGTLAGRLYQSPTGLRTNIYAVGIADSGGGKDHGRKWVKEAFFAAGLQHYLGGNRIASGQSILSGLTRHPAMLFQLDEFGHFLGAVLSPRSSTHKSEIWATMTELFTSADGWFQGTEYADQKEKPRNDIAQPCLSIHAVTVPAPFWKALENTSMLDGSLARWLIFRTDNDYPDAGHDQAPIHIPEHMVEPIRRLTEGAEGHDYGGNLSSVQAANIAPTPYTVPYGAGVSDMVRRLKESERDWLRQASGSGTGAIIARYVENAIKIALIHAISRDPARPVIEMPDMEWANALVTHCISTMIDEASRFIADNETEAKHKRVLEVIRKAGATGIRKTELTRRTHFLSRRDRDEVIAALVESGLVVPFAEKGKTKQTVIYTYHDPEDE